MSLEQTETTPSHITVTTDPVKVIKVRGKEVTLPPSFTPREIVFLLALLSLESEKVDNLLTQFKIKFTDTNGRVVFDWERGGWVK